MDNLPTSFSSAQASFLLLTLDESLAERDSLGASGSAPFQSTLNSTISKLLRCASMVDALALFSSNDTIVDISTASIRYLLIPYYLATLSLSLNPPIPEKFQSDNDNARLSTCNRLQILSAAQSYFASFVHSANLYSLISEQDLAYVSSYLAPSASLSQSQTQSQTQQSQLRELSSTSRRSNGNEELALSNAESSTFFNSPISSDLSKHLPRTPADMRQDKISRYRREKSTKEKLYVLTTQLQAQASTADDIDDELDRQLVLTTIDFATQRTVEELRNVKDEMELLESALSQMTTLANESGRYRDGSNVDKENSSTQMDIKLNSWKLDDPVIDDSGKILRPFTLTSKRSQLLKSVFQPSWRLPTMTIEEYLDLEYQRGNFLSGGGQQPILDKFIEDTDIAQDTETYRLRKWDEFTDNNQRGNGNRSRHG